jgi:hypothetical protein
MVLRRATSVGEMMMMTADLQAEDLVELVISMV